MYFVIYKGQNKGYMEGTKSYVVNNDKSKVTKTAVTEIGILIQMQNYKNKNVIKRKDLWNFFILFIFCSFFHFFGCEYVLIFSVAIF